MTEELISILIKHGFPTILSAVFIWIIIDGYIFLKKRVPEFLGSFSIIAENVKGLNANLNRLATHSEKIDEVHIIVKDIKDIITKD